MTKLFLSYARDDDEPFVRHLYNHLSAEGFELWWDRVSMPSRSLTFLHEIRDAIHEKDRVIVVIGPAALNSDYVRAEWQHALAEGKVVIPILRQGKYSDLPAELKDFHCPDFTENRDQQAAFQELINILRQPTPPLARHFGEIPALPAHFQPRPSLMTAIVDDLMLDLKQPITLPSNERFLILHGMGGAGKTTMAAAVARSTVLRRVFKDGVVWLNADQQSTPIGLVLKLCELLGGRPRHGSDIGVVVDKLRELLEGRRMLLIIDNAWEERQLTPILNTLDVNTRLFTTTRNAEMIAATGGRGIRADILSEAESLQHLADWTGLTVDDLPEQASELAMECGYLPFALALNGALLSEGFDWDDLLAALTASELDYANRKLSNYPHPNILRSLKVSIDALDKVDPLAGTRFQELSVFQWENGVPEKAVITFWQHMVSLSPMHSRKLVVMLEKRSLLRREGPSSKRWIYLHDLQLDFLRALAEDDKLNRALLDAYRNSSNHAWTHGPNDGYFLQNLAYHLLKAGQTIELYQLLTFSPDWMERKFTELLSDRSYMADLDLLEQSTADIRQLIRLNCARLVVGYRTSQYNDTDLCTLVRLGRDKEALGYAFLRNNVEARIDSLIAIHGELLAIGKEDPALLDSAAEWAIAQSEGQNKENAVRNVVGAYLRIGQFDAAQKIVDSLDAGTSKENALWDLTMAQTAAGHIQNALGNALSRKGDGKAPLLRKMVRKMWQTGQDDLLVRVVQEAEKAAMAIDDPQDRGFKLTGLTMEMARVGMYDRALEILNGMNNAQQVFVLLVVANAMEAEGVDGAEKLFEQAEKIIDVMQDPEDQKQALDRKIYLPAVMRNFDRAITLARGLEDGKERAKALSSVVKELLVTDQVKRAMELTSTIEPDERDESLALVALAYIGAGAFLEAQTVLNEIDNTHQNQTFWSEKVYKEDLVRLTDLGLASIENHDFEQAKLLRNRANAVLSGKLNPLESLTAELELEVLLTQMGRYDDARQRIESIDRVEDRVTLFRNVALAMARSGNPNAVEVFEEARNLNLREMGHGEKGAGAIAVALAAADYSAEAMRLAEKIEDDEILGKMAVIYAGNRQLDEALQLAARISDQYNKVNTLIAMGLLLDEAQEQDVAAVFDLAIDAAFSVKGQINRRGAILNVALALARARRFDQLTRLDQDERNQLAAAPHGAAHYSAIMRQATFEQEFYPILIRSLALSGNQTEAWQQAYAIEKTDIRALSLIALAHSYSTLDNLQTDQLFKDAESMLDHAEIRQSNDYEIVQTRLAEALIQAGKLEDAERIATREKEKPNIPSLKMLTEVAIRAGDLPKARKMISRYRLFLDDENSCIDCIKALVETGRKEDALELVDSLSSQSNAVIALGLIATAISHDDPDQAHQLFEKATALTAAMDKSTGDDIYIAKRQLANALARSGRFRDALDLIKGQTADEFMETLAAWSIDLEALEPGLFLKVARDSADVLSWINSFPATS